MTASQYHIPVLQQEVIEALHIQPNGIYVDCTFGGGGHAAAILAVLNEHGKLIAFDQDEEASKNVPNDSRITFIPQNFRYLQRFLKLQGLNQVDGILADLGVSSHQFDKAERGFSYRFNADIDMRMDQRQELTAVRVLTFYSEEKLHGIFEKYGEITNAKTLAKTIVQIRNTVAFKTIEGFKNALYDIVKGNPNKYFAQVFQALRIEVNDELGALKELLLQIPSLLKPCGRVAIITFHSLEDRIVKNFFKEGSFETEIDNPFTMTKKKSVLRIITKKPIEATVGERNVNTRSRSAKLRVAEKVDEEK